MRDGRLCTAALSLCLLLALLATTPAVAQDPGPEASPTPVIAILDTGIDPDHQEFTSCQVPPVAAWLDTTEGRAEPYDPPSANGIGHGTAVASVAIGATLGLAPCTPVAVARVCGQDGCTVENIRDGLAWAIDQEVEVINLSLGTTTPTPELLFDLRPHIHAARQAGILVTVSAGNGLLNTGAAAYPSYLSQPAANEEVLVVGAATQGETAARGTNTDPEVIHYGTEVRVAQAGTVDHYLWLNGTSFAAPAVAGIAVVAQEAWITEHGTPLAVEDLENLLKWTAQDDPWIPPVLEGWGFLDAATTLAQVPEGMPQRPVCPGPGALAGQLQPWNPVLERAPSKRHRPRAIDLVTQGRPWRGKRSSGRCVHSSAPVGPSNTTW